MRRLTFHRAVLGTLTLGAFLALNPGQSFAGTVISLDSASKNPVTTEDTSKSIYDKIWGLATLYKNPDNPYVQKLAFTGRFQAEYSTFDSNFGDYNEWIIRRWRMGIKAQVFENFTIHSEAGFSPQTDGSFYVRLTDTYLAWHPNDQFKLKVGKQSAPFTLDGHTSSKELLTIDRSNLSNNLWFPQEYMPGVTASYKWDNWRTFAGIYSSGSRSPEFGNFDGSAFGLASVGYDFADALGAEEALLQLDYVYQSANENNTFTRQLRNIGSLNFSYEKDPLGFRADLAGGTGYLGQSDLWGFYVMPFYDITKKLQVVGRYVYMDSADIGGLRLPRYSSRALSARGDDYNEFYAGLNYYLYGHKLKFQTGFDWVTMDNVNSSGTKFDGWGWTGAFRMSW
jgi:phosphate-selective porin OprO/OprP